MYQRNQIGALMQVYFFELYRQRGPDPENLIVYYPGIGGGDQTFDILSAFFATRADEVYGVDLLNGPDHIRDFEKALIQAKYGLEYESDSPNEKVTESNTEWCVEFNFKGKRRKLKISKVPTDVRTHDFDSGQVVYSRGTDNLVNGMADKVNERVEVITVLDDNDKSLRKVENHWKEKGFISLNYKHLVDLFRFTYHLRGDFSSEGKRILIKPKTSQ